MQVCAVKYLRGSPAMANKDRAVVCGIARDEDRYIVQWVAYYLSLGFDHIYLYDNMSITPIESLLSKRIQGRRVTVIRWPSIPGGDAQLRAYEHFLHTYGGTTEWAAVFDLDEFLNLKVDNNIHGFLARFPTAAGVAVNWRMFGSSGETIYQKIPMIERFTRAATIDFEANGLVKTIYRPALIETIHHHSAVYKSDAVVVSPDGRTLDASPFAPKVADGFAVAQINHYFTKSSAEWVVKNIRGYADNTKRTSEDFDKYNRNEEIETSIIRRAGPMRRMMIRVARSPFSLGSKFLRKTAYYMIFKRNSYDLL